MDRGAWQATVRRVAKSWIWLRHLACMRAQNSVLAEAPWCDYYIKKASGKNQEKPFIWKEGKAGEWWRQETNIYQILLNQALLLVPNFSFREVLFNKRLVFRKCIRPALFYINEKKVVKILSCLIIANTYGTYYVTGAVLRAFHVLTHVILRTTLLLTHYVNEKTEAWEGKVSSPAHRANTK